jgi:hypothetical protein
MMGLRFFGYLNQDPIIAIEFIKTPMEPLERNTLLPLPYFPSADHETKIDSAR